jgi:hypothetical protein
MAHTVYHRFVSQCDLGLDFHTSIRNRTTMYHTRADIEPPETERLAETFGTNVIRFGEGDAGSLRAVASRNGVPIITAELGKAHRFQSGLIEKALVGVESVLENPVALPGHPICHLVHISGETREEIEREISRGEFDGYRSYGQRWLVDEEGAE